MNRATVLLLSIALLASCGLWEEDKPRVFTDSCAHLPAGDWVSLGLETEVVTALASDPRDPGILYAGTGFHPEIGTAGRLYKSTDCGASWKLIRESLGVVRAIRIDPSNPSRIYVAGASVERSRNGGKSWEPISVGLMDNSELFVSFWTLQINPMNPDHIMAGSVGMGRGRVYETHNGGARWNSLRSRLPDVPYLTGDVVAIAFHPKKQIVGVVNASTSKLLVLENGGDKWIVNQNGDNMFSDITFLHSDDCTILSTDWRKGLRRSNDCGVTWTDVLLPHFQTTAYAAYRIFLPSNHTDLILHHNYSRPLGSLSICDLGLSDCSLIPIMQPSDYYITTRTEIASTESAYYLFAFSYGLSIFKHQRITL